MWECLYSKVQAWVIKLGFGPFLSLPVLKADRVLMTTLVKRWSPVTYAFHLPMVDMGMSPIDFYMMTGLSIGGTPSLSTDELDLDMVRRFMGSLLIEIYKGTKVILASWFETKYVWATDESSEEERDYFAQTFLIFM